MRKRSPVSAASHRTRRRLPFVIARSWDDASGTLERIPEHRLFGNRLRSSVERRRQILEGFRPPGRNELPAHRHDEQPGITPYDHVDRIGRADVVLRPNVARRLRKPVQPVKLFPSVLLCETAAHAAGLVGSRYPGQWPLLRCTSRRCCGQNSLLRHYHAQRKTELMRVLSHWHSAKLWQNCGPAGFDFAH